MTLVVVRVSRWRQVLPLVGCLIILAGSQIVVALRNPTTLTWIVTIVSAIGAVGCAGELSKDTKRLVIDHNGIWNSVWRIGVLRWKEMKGVFVRSDGGEDFICFSVCDRDEIRRRLGMAGRVFNEATRATGFGDLTLNASKLGLSAKEVVEFASKRIAEA